MHNRLEQLHKDVDRFFTAYNNQKVYLVLMSIIIKLVVVSFVAVQRMFIYRRHVNERATNAKLVFFTNISHELHTPLTLITAPINQLYTDSSITGDGHKLPGMAKRNCDILLRLVNETLDIRKVENGKMELQWKRFNLFPLMENWVKLFEPAMSRKHQTMHLNCPKELYVVSDIYKLERICYNLLSNAVKYIPGDSTIWVTVKSNESKTDICFVTSLAILTRLTMRH